jgi:hypothetical protein
MNTGTTLKSSITPSDSSFKHKISFIIDGATKHISDFISAGTTSYSYPIPHSWSPDKPSKTMTVRLYTYTSSGTLIATTDKIVTINVPDTIVPIISSVKASISSGLDGKYVQNKSQVTITVTAAPGNGSNIITYYYSGKNISGTDSSYSGASASKKSSTIQASGNQTYKVRVKDARGRYSDWKPVEIYVYPYSAPKVTSLKAQRCLENGTLDNNGTYAKVTVKTSHSDIGGSNAVTVTISNSKDSYIASTTVAASPSTSSIIYGSGFKIDAEYDIQATITDEYGATHTIHATLKAATRSLNIAKYGNGVAIGGLSTVTNATDNGLFECNWDTEIKAKLSVDGNIVTNGDFGCAEPYGGSNFAMYCQWKDNNNHDILVRSSDGLTMGLGWVGSDTYPTTLDIRPKAVSIRGATTIQGFRVPEIQHGNVSITPSAANTPTSKVVTFKQEFSGSPSVVASANTSVPGTTVLGVGTSSRSATGCTIWVTRTNTTETTVNWIAVY